MPFTESIRQLAREAGAEVFPSVRDLVMRAFEADEWQIDDPNSYCHRCGAPAGPHTALPSGCPTCVDTALPWRQFVRLSTYREPFDGWIREMKFGRRWAWAPWFGAMLSDIVPDDSARNGRSRTAVCPVPMHWRRRVNRGYNQAQLIARTIARRKGWPVADVLRRTRYTEPQWHLSATERERNVRGCFAAKPVDLSGWDIWLIDDVKTTGATLRQCARQLKKQKAANVHIAVAAVADPKHQDFRIAKVGKSK